MACPIYNEDLIEVEYDLLHTCSIPSVIHEMFDGVVSDNLGAILQAPFGRLGSYVSALFT